MTDIEILQQIHNELNLIGLEIKHDTLISAMAAVKSDRTGFEGLFFFKFRDLLGSWKDIFCFPVMAFLSAKTYYVGAFPSDVRHRRWIVHPGTSEVIGRNADRGGFQESRMF